MRRTLFVVSFALMSAGSVQAQALPYRVVFDLTSRDTLEQRAVLRWIKEVGTASPNAQMEVVMYAKGIELVMPERSTYTADVKEAMH
jgi:intracellular sulfur oxidation DsrE/DsrF family protein